MNAPLVKPNPSRSAGSTAVLEYLARIWPLAARRAELSSVFAEADTHTTATSPLAKRVDAALGNMVSRDMLSRRGSGADREWSLGPAAQLVGPQESDKPKAKAEAEAEAEAEQPVHTGEPVSAAKPDVMTGPTYCPKPMQALRPGSDDFTRLPSMRQGQRLPFTGGYVVMAGSKS